MAKRKSRINFFYLPAVIVMLIFIAYPLGRAIYLSFFQWNGYSSTMTFTGLKNYQSMMTDNIFFVSIRNTLIYGFGSTLCQQILGLAPYDWLAHPGSAIMLIVIINSWQFVGVSMVIYLAGIQGISTSYMEAAQIDGANAWQRFRYIMLPLLMPAISSSVIYNLIGGLKLYDVIISLTQGGPGKMTNSLATYIANRYFDAERAGYAAAIGFFSFVMIMIISTIVNGYFRKKEVEY